MDNMQISASSYASTVVNVQCENTKNATWAACYSINSLLKSHRGILTITFLVYAILGALIFAFLESDNEATEMERRNSQIERKRFEMMHRIQLSWEKYELTKIRAEFYNDSLDSFRWFENEWAERKFYEKREKFWTYENALWFVGASVSTAGFHLNVLRTKLGQAFYVCFSTFGICVFCTCCWKFGYLMHRFAKRLLRICERYRTSRPRAKNVIIFGFIGPTLLAAQHGLLYYISECDSYLEIFETHFYTVTTLGLTNPDVCIKKKFANRLFLLICIFTWISTVAAFVHSFQYQQYLLYKYIFRWLTLQTEENLHTTSTFSYYHAFHYKSHSFVNFLITTLQCGFFERILLKTLNEKYYRKLYKLYYKLYQRYGQDVQTDPIKFTSRGTMTNRAKVFLWESL